VRIEEDPAVSFLGTSGIAGFQAHSHHSFLGLSDSSGDR
jgi:hypothetical protein